MCQNQNIENYEEAGEVSYMELQKGHEDLYRQEAQLPQRNSASATHDYLGWSADLLMITLGDTMHRTQQNRRCCVIF